MSDVLHVRYTKWDGSLHWHFDATDLGTDVLGRWVMVPAGGAYRRGTEPERVEEHGFVVLFPEGRWWTAYFNSVPRGENGHLVYVDINTPATWEDGTAQLIDLDLDVTLGADGRVHLLDEDEFEHHRVAFGYPQGVSDRVRAEAALVFGAVETGAEPFGTAGFAKLAHALGWTHGTVVAGHGAASGRNADPRFGEGTLALQFPHFERLGIDLSGIHRATINVALSFELVPRTPLHRVELLEWKPDYPPETFEFFTARIAVAGTTYPALMYRPDPVTKPDFEQPGRVVELLAPYIPAVAPGTPVSVWVDPAQASFVG